MIPVTLPLDVIGRRENCQGRNEENRWRRLRRIFSDHPLDRDVSIETTIEERRGHVRVRVSSGIECTTESPPHDHVMFSLGGSRPPEGENILCWTELESHRVLCVLAEPTVLRIFDPFPDPKSPLVVSGDGWTVNLPFICDSIHDFGKGILLQRKEDPQDCFQQGVSSLFSLHHPLEDVLPVALFDPNALQNLLVSDSSERILWVGESRHVPTDKAYVEKSVESHLWIVSYNNATKNHSVWSLQNIRGPGRTVPLYQQTRLRRDKNNFNAHTTTLEDMQLLGISSSQTPMMGTTPYASRNEALADALGVRRSPRLSLEPSARSRHGGTRVEQSLHQSFLSPTNKSSFFAESDTMVDVQAPLQPKCCIQKIFTDDYANKANKVFLASNLAASGTLVLALHLSRDEERMAVLDLFEINLKPGRIPAEISKVASLECSSAAPVQAVATPSCHLPHPKYEQSFAYSTDILVHGKDHLGLYRVDNCLVQFHHEGIHEYDILDSRKNLIILEEQRNCDSPWKVARIDLGFNAQVPSLIFSAVDACFCSTLDKTSVLFALSLRADAVSFLRKSGFDSSAQEDCTERFLIFLVLRLLDISHEEETSPKTDWEMIMAMPSICNQQQLPSFLVYLPQRLSCGSDAGFNFSCLRFVLPKNLAGYIDTILLSLHTVTEDSRLYLSRRGQVASALHSTVWKLLKILKENAIFLDQKNVSKYYFGDLELESSPRIGSQTSLELSFSPFSFYDSLRETFARDLGDSSFPLVEDIVSPRLRSLVRIFESIIGGDSAEKSITIMVEEGMKDMNFLRYELPSGVALPLLEVLYKCEMRSTLEGIDSPDLTHDAWSLMGRTDMTFNISGETNFRSNFNGVKQKLGVHDSQGDTAMKNENEADLDGLLEIESQAAMIFPQDNRVREAAKLLRSSQPVSLRVHRSVEVSDHDYEKLKQKKLAILCNRVLALSPGRGLLTVGNLLNPIPAQTLPKPPICLKGRFPPTNATMALDLSESPADFCVWPYFHNGVASALRLPHSDSEYSDFKATRTWIIYNRPASDEGGDSANATNSHHVHGGFLLGLGLRGHLSALDMSDLYDYLTQGSVTTTVGVLLGMSANKRGSCDMSVSKMLCLHIPSLIPQHFSAMDVAATVQTAAIAGAGLLYQGSSHRMMTEFLLSEIGKRPDSDISVVDRESHNLTCGWALGMVNLCVGTSHQDGGRVAGIADLNVEERLLRFALGGIDPDEQKRKQEINDRFSMPSVASGAESEKCSVISESPAINTDVTAPGSILGLGLMYLQSNNKALASALQLPQSLALLEGIRPDFLGLRIISTSLIMWDKVQATSEWMKSQIPGTLMDCYEDMRQAAKAAGEGVRSKRFFPFDRQAVRQLYAHTRSAACFAIGLRYAGTGDSVAKAFLLENLRYFLDQREGTDACTLALTPGSNILEIALGSVALAVSMVCAGTGDLEVLKILRVLRWRCDGTVMFGNHMAYGMAIGLLFLGGGRYTLGRAPEDIAALLLAFYPRFATTSMDNQYHLQAFRHMYALAIRRRDVTAFDIDTQEEVHVPVELHRDSGVSVQTTPCLLLFNDSLLRSMRVCASEYYPVEFNYYRGSFYVKKRGTNNGSGSLAKAIEEHVEESVSIFKKPERALPLHFSFLQGRSVEDLALVTAYYQHRRGHLLMYDDVAHYLEVAERNNIEKGTEDIARIFYNG